MSSDAENKDSGGGGASLVGAVKRETASASEHASAAVDAVKDQAKSVASSVAGKATESVESGKDFAASNIEDFAAAIRKASEELGTRDQSMVSNLVREAASGLEQASRSIKGASLQDITHSVAGFARRQPGAFLLGAGLLGIALGRFARASGEHASADGRPGPAAGRSATREPYAQREPAAEPGFDPSLSGSGARSSWNTEAAPSPMDSDIGAEMRPLTGDDYVR